MEGLTRQEVEYRKNNGLSNDEKVKYTRTTKEIVLSNTITLFNILNIALMVLTLTGCGGSSGDDITTYTYSSELDIKNLDSSDADDGCSLKAIHAVIDGLTKTDKKEIS